MKKKIRKTKKVIQPFFQKTIFFAFLLGFVSILYVFQVAAQTTSEKTIAQATPLKKETLTEDSPIHIAPGFNQPLSLGKPSRIIIPQVSIDIAVAPAAIIDGHWEVSELFANHGQGSAYPGQSGNMVIFAHARENLFINLQNVVVHDALYVLTDNKWYAYTVTDITQVYPDQVEVIAPTTDERLTMFTCSGFEDEKRLIVVAKRNDALGETVIRKIY